MKTIVSDSAKKDLAEAKKYYKNIRPQLAKDFLAEIKNARNFIGENPFANDISYHTVRMHLIKRFPYQLHYIFEEKKKQIVIIAVEFGKRGDLDYSHRI